MQRSQGSNPLSALKSHLGLFTVLSIALLTTGCSQMSTIKEKQVLLERNLSINADMTASIIMKMQEQKEEMESTLDLFHKEQQAILTNQKKLQQHVATVTSHAKDLDSQITTISQEMSTLTADLNSKHQRLAANYSILSERQNTVLEAVQELQENNKTHEANLASLRTDQDTIAELLVNDQGDRGTLATTCQTLIETVSNMQEQQDSRHQEVQAMASKLDQATETLTAALAPIQEHVAQLTANVDTLQSNQTHSEQAILKQSDDLLAKIQILQTQYAKWQTDLTTLQQETEQLQSSTTSLDSRITQAFSATEQK